MMTGVSSSCGACKFLRRKCTNECVFAPYFRYDEASTHFAAVHKVFGASNVSRLLIHHPEQYRSEVALSITYEALARIRDPVYGCVAYIYALQREVANLQEEIEIMSNHQMPNNSTGISSHYEYQYSQAASNGMSNNSSLKSISQENPVINLQEHCWTSPIMNQEDASLISQEGSSCVNYSNNNEFESLLLDQPKSFTCDWQRHTDFDIHDVGVQEALLEGASNTLSFESFPWLAN